MNPGFERFVKENRHIAATRSINWDIAPDPTGAVSKATAWNLTLIAGGTPPPTLWLADMGTDQRTVEILNSHPPVGPKQVYRKTVLTLAWQDLIKASVIHQLFVLRNTPNNALYNIVRPLRVIATCSMREPWEVIIDDASFAIETAKQVQASGKLADLVHGIFAGFLDLHHLLDNGPLAPLLQRDTKRVDKRAAKIVRKNLHDRKGADRLPDQRSFWELVRIIYSEAPRTFLDKVRFAHIRAMMLTGLRIGEVTLLPADWKRYQVYMDRTNRPAGESGGYSQSLMLRHFAEKQRNMNDAGMALFENVQHVSPMIENTLTESLDEVLRITEPLRKTLRRQIETGRTLPEFGSELVLATELYTYLTGNPFIFTTSNEVKRTYISRYLQDFNPAIFDEIREVQLHRSRFGSQFGSVDHAVRAYFRRLDRAPLRKANGTVWLDGIEWESAFVDVRELEGCLTRTLPTKRSDTLSLRLVNGELAGSDLLFLMPKRALAEGFGDGLCDVTRYCSVGRLDSHMIINCLGSTSNGTLFSRYGRTDDDRALVLDSHSLRHLKNNECFRLGASDAAITTHFNRRHVAQSYEYDHRSLAEELAQIDLPQEVEDRISEKASVVVKMIKLGKANGPIVNEFKRIQKSYGDDAALDYLRVEADGFHATPYGHCLNSFTVDPCPKHLECFAGCRHLSATNLPENRHNLVVLERRLDNSIKDIESRPSDSVGWKNQLEHGRTRLSAVRQILATAPGEQVFPEGPDLSIRTQPGGILDTF